jgi:rare lipoprotein A
MEPSYNKIGYVQRGTASYYAEDFHGRKTANGEKFDMNSLTAAHPRIRFNTVLRVTNTENGKSVMVRVNDRGPYVGGRILDLSKEAAKKIDMVRHGTALITAEVITTEDIPTIKDIEKRKEEQKENAKKSDKTNSTNEVVKVKDKTKVGSLLDKIKNALLGKKQTNTTNEPKKESTQDDKIDKKQEQPKKQDTKTQKQDEIEEVMPNLKKDTKKQTPNKTTETENNEVMPQQKPNVTKPSKTETEKKNVAVIESDFQAMNTYNIWGTEKFPEGHGIQIGSYSDFAKAMEIAKSVHQTGIATVYIQVGAVGDKKIYRVLAGEGEVATVRSFIPLLQEKGYNGTFVKQHY